MSEPPTTSNCGRCGRPLSQSALRGSCPACLWAVAASFEVEPARPAGPRRFGSYQLLEEIARGGMGVVWRARQEGLGRDVALKMVLAGNLATSAQVLRFHTEARAAARLSHPNIVPIFEIAEEEGCHYYSMQLMEGGSLADLLRREGPPPTARAVHMVATVARAIHFAHQRGVLHRDVKPSNLLLDPGGEPHVVDFGLARLADDAPGVTRTEAILGTPAYMAPEQASGSRREVTTAADIYGLGAVLHELLTGRPPFEGESPLETVRRVVNDPAPPLRSLRPGADRNLEVICLKCLEKLPEKRYATAAELAEDLERWLAGKPILARPSTPLERLAAWARRKPELATALAALSTVLALAFGVSLALYLRAERESVARAAALRLEEGQRLAFQSLAVVETNPGQAMLLALGAASRAPSTSANNALLAALEACRERRRFLGHTRSVNHATFDPTGEVVATAGDDGTARLWSAATGEPRAVLAGHQGGVRTATFDAAGLHVLTAGNDGTARIWDARSGAELHVLAGHESPLRSGVFSPSGERVLTVARKGARIWDARTGSLLEVLDGHSAPLSCGRFSPDGSEVVTGALDGTARIWQVSSGTARATLRGRGNLVLEVAYSPDGLQLATGEDNGACLWDTARGVRLHELRGHEQSVYSVAWSAAGDLVATGSEDFTARIWEAHTGRQLQVLRHGHKVISVAIAAGEDLLLTGSYDRSARVWDLRRGTLLSEMVGHAAPVQHVAFSPGGRELLTASVDHSARLWTVRPSMPFVISTEADPPLIAVTLAPDGLAVAQAFLDGREPRVLELPSRRERSRLEGHTERVWSLCFSPGGDRLLTGAETGACRLWEVSTGKCLRVLKQHSGRVLLTAFSADGRQLLTGSEEGARVDTLEEGAEVAFFKSGGALRTACFTPGGTHLVLADAGNVLHLGEIATGDLKELRLAGQSLVSSADLSPEGGRILSTSLTTRAGLHSFPGGEALGTLLLSTRAGYAWFSRDGRFLAALEEEAIRVWRGPELEEHLELRRKGFRPNRAQFTPDSRGVLVQWLRYADNGDPVTAAAIYPLEPLEEARRASPGDLTPDERDRFHVGSPEERNAHRGAWRGGQIYGELQH